MIDNNISSNQRPLMVVQFYWFLYIENKHVKRGRENGDRHKLRNFKHKLQHKIGCCPKFLLIFTSYQVQGWRNMIISTVKYQPDGINVIEILLKSSWYTHQKHFKTYLFILQKVKNPPDGFCTNLFFASATILQFGGLFLHMISRILNIKLNWTRVPINDFARKIEELGGRIQI